MTNHHPKPRTLAVLTLAVAAAFLVSAPGCGRPEFPPPQSPYRAEGNRIPQSLRIEPGEAWTLVAFLLAIGGVSAWFGLRRLRRVRRERREASLRARRRFLAAASAARMGTRQVMRLWDLVHVHGLEPPDAVFHSPSAFLHVADAEIERMEQADLPPAEYVQATRTLEDLRTLLAPAGTNLLDLVRDTRDLPVGLELRLGLPRVWRSMHAPVVAAGRAALSVARPEPFPVEVGDVVDVAFSRGGVRHRFRTRVLVVKLIPEPRIELAHVHGIRHDEALDLERPVDIPVRLRVPDPATGELSQAFLDAVMDRLSTLDAHLVSPRKPPAGEVLVFDMELEHGKVLRGCRARVEAAHVLQRQGWGVCVSWQGMDDRSRLKIRRFLEARAGFQVASEVQDGLQDESAVKAGRTGPGA